jgi:hypothetical protein
MKRYASRSPELSGTASAARDHLALPMGTALARGQVAEVVAACRAVLRD